jgi:hypothetical protein
MKVWAVSMKNRAADGTVAVNTIAAKVEVVGPDVTEASPAKVADEASSWLTTSYLGLLHPSWTLEEVAVKELTSGADEAASHVVGSVGTLPASTGLLPVEVCGVLTLKTAFATRSKRGRLFLPSPLQSGQLTGVDVWSTVGTTYGARCAAFGATLLAGHDFTEGVVNYHMSAGVWSRKLGSFQDATATQFRTRPHWLRSRSTAP